MPIPILNEDARLLAAFEVVIRSMTLIKESINSELGKTATWSEYIGDETAQLHRDFFAALADAGALVTHAREAARQSGITEDLKIKIDDTVRDMLEMGNKIGDKHVRRIWQTVHSLCAAEPVPSIPPRPTSAPTAERHGKLTKGSVPNAGKPTAAPC